MDPPYTLLSHFERVAGYFLGLEKNHPCRAILICTVGQHALDLYGYSNAATAVEEVKWGAESLLEGGGNTLNPGQLDVSRLEQLLEDMDSPGEVRKIVGWVLKGVTETKPANDKHKDPLVILFNQVLNYTITNRKNDSELVWCEVEMANQATKLANMAGGYFPPYDFHKAVVQMAGHEALILPRRRKNSPSKPGSAEKRPRRRRTSDDSAPAILSTPITVQLKRKFDAAVTREERQWAEYGVRKRILSRALCAFAERLKKCDESDVERLDYPGRGTRKGKRGRPLKSKISAAVNQEGYRAYLDIFERLGPYGYLKRDGTYLALTYYMEHRWGESHLSPELESAMLRGREL